MYLDPLITNFKLSIYVFHSRGKIDREENTFLMQELYAVEICYGVAGRSLLLDIHFWMKRST